MIKIFYSEYFPTNLKDFDISKKYLIFSGIGNPNSFKNLLYKNNFIILNEMIYPDHYNYKQEDLDTIKNKAEKRCLKKILKAISFFFNPTTIDIMVIYNLCLYAGEILELWPTLLKNYRFYSISKKFTKYTLFKAPLREQLISSMCIKNFTYEAGD